MAEQGRSTQNQKVLAILQSGRSLTPLEALDEIGSFRLGARVHQLKALGYDIQTRMVKKNGKHFAEYFLPLPRGQLDFFGQQKGPVGASPTEPLVRANADDSSSFQLRNNARTSSIGLQGRLPPDGSELAPARL